MIGRIYRIIHLESELCYIGSTTNELRFRWQGHIGSYKHWMKNNTTAVSIFPYFKQYGIEQFKMVLVKEYEVESRKHLQVYEQLWMYKFRKSAVNKNSGFHLKHLDREKQLKQMKQHREKTKDERERKAKIKSVCECGGSHSEMTKSHHTKTKRHQAWMLKQSKKLKR